MILKFHSNFISKKINFRKIPLTYTFSIILDTNTIFKNSYKSLIQIYKINFRNDENSKQSIHRNLIPQKFSHAKFAIHGPHSELDKNFTRPNRGQLRPVEWKLFANCQNPFNFSQKLRNCVCERVHAHTSPTRGQNFLPALYAVRAYYKNMLSISCSQTFDGKACEESRWETKAERICVSPFPNLSWNEKTKGK